MDEKMLERVKRSLSVAERDVAKEICNIMGDETEKTINSSVVAAKAGVSKSTVTVALKLLYMMGIVDSRSRGAAGVFVEILDREAFEKLVS